jgi:hypothetical protein
MQVFSLVNVTPDMINDKFRADITLAPVFTRADWSQFSHHDFACTEHYAKLYIGSVTNQIVTTRSYRYHCQPFSLHYSIHVYSATALTCTITV